tara:strand:- start:115 stop:306 length:192 start_codon:yes stop_codon:yes gene_type:complete
MDILPFIKNVLLNTASFGIYGAYTNIKKMEKDNLVRNANFIKEVENLNKNTINVMRPILNNIL